ncbi:MAG: hypothetical protein ACREL7_19830 [Longimicrobiales bacterium]
MSDLRDLSSLPHDRAYWDDLEARVLAGVGAGAGGIEGPAWWMPLARRAWTLSGLAAASLVALLLVSRADRDHLDPAGLLRVPEGDPRVAAFLLSPAPPPIVSIVLPTPAASEGQ